MKTTQLFSLLAGVTLVVACIPAPGEGDFGAGGTGPAAGGTGEVPAGGNEVPVGPGAGGAAGSGPATGGAAQGGIPEPRCTPDEEAFAWQTPKVLVRAGIEGSVRIGRDPVVATVGGVGNKSIEFEVDGEAGSFHWPDRLPFVPTVGAEVKLARSGHWNILVSDQGTLAVLYHDDLGSLEGRFPEGPTSLLLATHCHVPLEPAECESGTPFGYLYSLVIANEPLGLFPGVVARPGGRAEGGGWVVENHRVAHFPGASVGDCIVESQSRALLTAHTRHAQLAPF